MDRIKDEELGKSIKKNCQENLTSIKKSCSIEKEIKDRNGRKISIGYGSIRKTGSHMKVSRFCESAQSKFSPSWVFN